MDHYIEGLPVLNPPAMEARMLDMRRQRIPIQTLDAMAAILFDERDEWPEAAGLSRLEAVTSRSPIQRHVEERPWGPVAREMERRALNLERLMKDVSGVYNMGPDVYAMLQEAVQRLDHSSGKAVFYAAPRVLNRMRGIHRMMTQRARRKKRHSRFNRGKLGMRPRKRCPR